MDKLSMKVCKLDKTPICELLDNTQYKARNILEKFAINEVTTLSFDLPLTYNGKWKNLSNETLIYFNDEYYNVKTVQFTHSQDNKLLLHVEAKHLSEILASQLISVEETTPRNIVDLLKIALMYDENGVSQTGWTIGDINVDKVKLRGLEANEQSPFSIILSIVEKWDAIAIFDSKTMKVNVIPSKSTDHPSLDLRVSKNLKEVNITYDTSEICTRLYGYGGQDEDGNDLDFMSVNPTGLPYVDNFDYFVSKGYELDYIKANPEMFVRTNIYREDSIYDPQDLYENTIAELEKVAQPKVEVNIQALNTKRIRANNIVNVGLGDCVLVHDEDLGMSFVCNVISKEIDYENPHLLNVELVNSIQYRDIIAELFNSVNNVSSIVHSGNIGGGSSSGAAMDDVIRYLNLYYLSSEQIDAKYINAEEIRTNYLTAEQIKATYIDADSIASKYATITELNAVKATIDELDVDVLDAKLAEIEELTTNFADITELIATDAEIEELKAGDVTITGKIKANEANIDTIKATYVQVGSLEAYRATIEKLNATNADIDSLKAKYIDALAIESDTAKIEQLEAAIAKIETLESTLANVEKLVSQTVITDNLEANKATIDSLDAKLATIDTAIIDIAKIEDLQAANAQIENLNTQHINAVQADVDNLNAKSATIEQLLTYTLKSEFGEFKNLTVERFNAANADIGSLDANVANINSVLAGNIGTGLLQTVHLTADNVVIDDAVIKSANIESIDTDLVTVGNDNITLSGSTQQFKDENGNVRAQIGLDAEGEFSFIICDENGATIITGSGVTENAIPDGLIVDKMVADDAGIQASKVNYIDKDGNKTLQTVISTEQGRIENLIKETTIENEDGSTTTLKDAYAHTIQTVEGIETTIGDVTTLGEDETIISSMTKIKETADGVSTTVSQNKDSWDNATTIAEQTAEKFNWIVKSGTNESDFELTDRTATLVAENINLNGLVTFFSGSPTEGSTSINGEWIQTNTIDASKINVSELMANEAVIEAIQTTKLNADMITSGVINTNLLNLYGLKVYQQDTEIETLSIENNGDVTIRGSVESYNYVNGKSGWSIKTNGDAEFNDVIVRGSVVTNDGGIVSSGGSGTNLLTNSSFYNKTTQTAWNTELNGDYTAAKWGGYNSSKTDAATGYHAHLYELDGEWVYRFVNENNTWLGIANGINGKIEAGKTYTFSCDIRRPSGSTSCIRVGLYSYLKDATDPTFNSGQEDLVNISDDVWERVSYTFTANANIDTTRSLSMYIYGHYIGTGTVYLRRPKLEEGDVDTAWSLSPDDTIKQVRFWAGSSYEERESAPWIVYNDGSMVSTKGTFSGVFTGEIEIGNISIIDPSKTSGNDAIVTIQHGGNGIKRVQLRDTESSEFAQSIKITDNSYNEMIALGQDGYGLFSGGVTIGNKTKSSVLTNDTLNLNGSTIDGSSSGQLDIIPTTLNIGKVSSKTNLNVYGSTLLNEDVTFNGSIMIGNKLKITTKSNGVDIDFVEQS